MWLLEWFLEPNFRNSCNIGGKMRIAVAALVVVAGLVGVVVGAFSQHSNVYAQFPSNQTRLDRSQTGDLIALNWEADGRQQVTLIDPKTRAMAVYEVERNSGKISLKGVRNVHWDLLMEEFNGEHPLPREIRSMLEQR
jgi:hypothetical protein